jgi:hypothetical protein
MIFFTKPLQTKGIILPMPNQLFKIDDNKVFYVIIDGTIDDGFIEVFRPEFLKMVEKHNGIRFLIDVSKFKDWDHDAAFTVHTDLLEAARKDIKGKIAYINLPDEDYIKKFDDPAFDKNFEVKGYKNDNVSEALTWVSK